MNFALSSSHTRGSSSKRVLILQADELEQSHTPHQRAELVRQLRERSAIAPSFALIWARAGASLWGGAVLVSAGVIAFATSPPPIKERRPSRKAHVSDPIPEEEA